MKVHIKKVSPKPGETIHRVVLENVTGKQLRVFLTLCGRNRSTAAFIYGTQSDDTDLLAEFLGDIYVTQQE